MSELQTLEDGRTVKTYSEKELRYIREKEKKRIKKKSSKKRYQSPRGKSSGGLMAYSRMFEVKPMGTKLKSGHESWPYHEKKVMQLGIDQLIQKKDSLRQERLTEQTGLVEMEKEIQTNIDQAALQVKAAKMALASLLFDQDNGITINKHKNRVIELEQEIDRSAHNIEVFQKQLDEGRPIPKKPKEADKHGQYKKEEVG